MFAKSKPDISSLEKNINRDVIDVLTVLLKEKETICSWCFDILINELKSKDYKHVPTVIKELTKGERHLAFFVKWMRLYNEKNLGSYDNNLYELKGCTGCLIENELTELRYYTLQSALNDLRFDPIVLEDVPYLMLTVTYIFHFEKCTHIYDWEIGKHGVQVHFKVRGKNYSATLLPEVALEHNFTHESTIHKLIRKANFNGEITQDLLNKLEVERYQGISCSMTYSDYKNFMSTKK